MLRFEKLKADGNGAIRVSLFKSQSSNSHDESRRHAGTNSTLNIDKQNMV